MKVDQTAELQTITHYYNPIRPVQLDSIFHATLKQEGWNVQVGITYSDYHKQSHQHSNTDMSIYSSSFHTDIIPLGLNNEMTVQAFVRFHPHWLFQKGGRFMLGITILWLVLCGVYLFVWLRQRRKANPLSVPVEEMTGNEEIKEEEITTPSDISPEKEATKREKENQTAIGKYNIITTRKKDSYIGETNSRSVLKSDRNILYLRACWKHRIIVVKKANY